MAGMSPAVYLSLRSGRGLPYAQADAPPNTQQVRAETAAADAVIPLEGLDVRMGTVTHGAGVPVVFCREVSGAGGCWVSPQCVQMGFQTATANDDVQINYMLVVGQGEYPAIAAADVFYGDGLFNALTDYSIEQTYESLPSNVLTTNFLLSATLDDRFPAVTGSGGSMSDLTLLGCYAYLESPATWDRQIHAFMREGVKVTRYTDGILGPSNNFADLVKYLLTASGELQPALVDETALETAALFLDAEALRFSGVLTSVTDLDDYLNRTAPLFLCIPTYSNGQRGMIPALPLNGSYLLSTDAVAPDHEYTTAELVTGSLRINYVPATERKPFKAVMAWRDPASPGRVRTTEVGYNGYATAGPFERYDVSAFCTDENQAIRIGRYILAQRLYVGHTIQFQLLPDATPPAVGDTFRLMRDIMPNGADARRERFSYLATSVSIAPDGVVIVTATHLPRDSAGASQVAQEITTDQFLSAQVPEDWDNLPAYDGAVGAAVVGGDYIVATGGTITYDGDFKVHTFAPEVPLWGFSGQLPNGVGGLNDLVARYTSTNKCLTDTLRIVSVPPGATMDYLIVGGGGCAVNPRSWGYDSAYTSVVVRANIARGGGGGEVLAGTLTPSAGVFPVEVGANGWTMITYSGNPYGGAYTVSYQLAFYNAGASTFLGLTAAAGENSHTGTGDTYLWDLNGGNAGGSGNGNAAGTNFLNRTTTSDPIGQNGPGGYGGGGGAGSVGTAGSSSGGGDGGAGVFSSITGSSVEYGAGGGGNAIANFGTSAIPAYGLSRITPGSGGGAVASPTYNNAGNATTPGFLGRCGIVVVRYRYRN